jgi:hypothetical protein
MGLDPPLSVNEDAGERFDAAALGWRLPCMIGHEQPRTLLMSLADGSRLSFQNEHHDVDLRDAERKLTERYGGRRGTGQQDGAHRLETNGYRRKLRREVRARRVGGRRLEISQTRGATQLQPC